MRLIPLLALLLTACAPTSVDAVRWQPIPVFAVPDPALLVAVEPVPLLAGDPAPADGWWVADADLERLVGTIRDAADAYDALLRILQLDRTEADATHADVVRLLTTCRSNQPKIAAAACAACAGVGGGIVGAACAGTR